METSHTNSATHDVPGAAITVTPVSGTDFPAFVTVSAINPGAVWVMQMAGSNTNSQGEFSSTTTIPNFSAGSSTILATA